MPGLLIYIILSWCELIIIKRFYHDILFHNICVYLFLTLLYNYYYTYTIDTISITCILIYEIYDSCLKMSEI